MENKIKELEEKLLHKDKELQEAIDNYVQLDLRRVKEYNELVDLYKAKEQECEDLKAEIKHYKQIAQYHGNLSVKYTNKSAKYKQTLTEIKEIAKNAKKDICNDCAWRNTDSCDPEYYTCGELIKILQKSANVG